MTEFTISKDKVVRDPFHNVMGKIAKGPRGCSPADKWRLHITINDYGDGRNRNTHIPFHSFVEARLFAKHDLPSYNQKLVGLDPRVLD